MISKIGFSTFSPTLFPLYHHYYFSRYMYIEVQSLTSTTSASIIRSLKSIFARHGIPMTMMSDNGPQYSSQEFSSFAEEYQFEHVTSSPHYPQANGLAERAVRTIKGLLQKSTDPYLALLAHLFPGMALALHNF